MLGRRPLSTAALTAPVTVHVSGTLQSGVVAGVSAGVSRPVSGVMTSAVESGVTVVHGRSINGALAAAGSSGVSAGVERLVSGALASSAEAGATVGNGLYITLRSSFESGGRAGVVRGIGGSLVSGVVSGLLASQSRPVSLTLQAGVEAGLVAGSARGVAGVLSGGVISSVSAGLRRSIAGALTASGLSGLTAGHYNPSLIRIYGPVAAEWDQPRILALWDDQIIDGDITMSDKPMIAGTNAAKVVRLYPDNGDLEANGITLAGCHSFSAKACRVDGTGPAVTLSVASHGDPTQGRVLLEHTADAFAPGVYSLQISYRDGADHKHTYPDDGDSLRLIIHPAL